MKRWEPVREILLMDGAQYPERVPFLNSHDRSDLGKQIGSTTEIRREGDRIVAKNIYAKTPEAEAAWTLARDGHARANSIGYRVHKFTQIKPGEKKTINEREFTAPADQPLRVTTQWEIVENSAVVVPADAGALNRTEDRPAVVEQNSPHYWRSLVMFEKWLKERGIDPEGLSEAQRAALKADFEAITAADKPKADPIVDDAIKRQQDLEAGKKAERARVAAIRELAGNDVDEATVRDCIEQGRSPEECQAIFLKIIRGQRATIHAPMIQVHDSTLEREHLEAAVLMRAGFDDVVLAEYGEKTADRADKAKDLCLHDLCVRALAMEGQAVPLGRDEMIRAAFSTTTLPNIFSAVANKALLAGYNGAPNTWKPWCSVGSVPDFKTNTRVRLTDSGDLVEVTANGEVAHGTALEEPETFSIATYAKQFAITRTNVINDDLNAFTRTPQRFGRRAAQNVAKLVYTHLLANGTMGDSAALFVAAGHANLNTSAALSLSSLATALTGFRNQTDADGQPIDVEPKYLLVSPTLEVTAKEIVMSPIKIATDFAAAASTVAAAGNYFSGSLEVIVEPRLSNSAYTGYSTTTWYLVASPADVDTIEVAFLNGRQTPTIERFNASPEVLGIIYRVYHDVGVKALDWRGMCKNTA